MAEPPRVPPEPDDETVIVPPSEEWGPESEVFVEERTTEPAPRRRLPVIWPWLLALLLLVLAGLAAAYFLTRDDDEAATTTASTATTAATTATTATTAAQVSVPDVVGTTSSEATRTLRDAGFDVNVVAVPSDQPSGQVVAQSPAAGTDAAEGSTVRLNVAQKAAQTTTTTDTTTAPTTTTTTTTAAPEPAVVPDVVGQELADAARAFNDEGLKVAVAYVPSQEPRGRVVAQAQPAGTERTKGDTVQLNVSTGPEPPERTAVPDVAGTKQNPAREQLSTAGFEVLALEQATADRAKVGFVLSQTPSGGASIPRGSLVLLYVGA